MANKRKITDIYAGYFQKSKVFLYPALGHKRGTGITPIETYVSWEDKVRLADCKLVCIFYLRDDPEFIKFEEEQLLGNSLFEDFHYVGKDKAAYVFDFESFDEDFSHVMNGRYSQLSDKLKIMIKKHYGATTVNYAFIDTYLYPEDHYDLYAKFLCPDKEDIPKMIDILEGVGELCSKPDLHRETLKLLVKSLDLGKL